MLVLGTLVWDFRIEGILQDEPCSIRHRFIREDLGTQGQHLIYRRQAETPDQEADVVAVTAPSRPGPSSPAGALETPLRHEAQDGRTRAAPTGPHRVRHMHLPAH